MENEKYKLRYRRNNKERYWVTKEIAYLSDFSNLMNKIFSETNETKLEIIIEKKADDSNGK